MQNQILDYTAEEKTIKTDRVRHAGFFDRACASIIDVVILIPLAILLYFCFRSSISMGIVFGILVTGLSIAYKPYMEYKYGATIGKQQMDLVVVTTDYKKINLEQALLRSAPWLIRDIISMMSYASLLFGFRQMSFYGLKSIQSFLSLFIFISVVTVMFSSKKQGLHDKIGGTYCIHKY